MSEEKTQITEYERSLEAERQYLRDTLDRIASLGGAQGVLARSALREADYFLRQRTQIDSSERDK